MSRLYTKQRVHRNRLRKRHSQPLNRTHKVKHGGSSNTTGPFVDPPNKKIVISQPFGGLGDNLQYTTLPELFSKKGYDVYVSSDNKYRSDELYGLIWKLNPYVKGVSKLPTNAGEIVNKYTNYSPAVSYIKNIELAHGLDEGYRKYPVIYYKPKHVKGISKYLLYDPTYVSERGEPNLHNSFASIFSKYPQLTPHMIQFKKKYSKNSEFEKIKKTTVNGLETAVYEIDDIYHFCDVLYSCKVFTCGFSGGSVLASAIKQDRATPEVYSFHSTGPHFHPHYFMFENIQYLPVV